MGALNKLNALSIAFSNLWESKSMGMQNQFEVGQMLVRRRSTSG